MRSGATCNLYGIDVISRDRERFGPSLLPRNRNSPLKPMFSAI